MVNNVEGLERIVKSGVPADAVQFFGRWWELETYLRELVYVEFRALFGIGYKQKLGPRPAQRAEKDRDNAYMASADAGDLLAYCDAGELLDLIAAEWDLFEPCLLPRNRWEVAAELMRELRNRITHCRRPHGDDLPRLEQLLRDLDHGAKRFYASYNAFREMLPAKDPVVKAWVDGKHSDARRLLAHARSNYDTNFDLAVSRRPWTTARVDPKGSVSGEPGFLWHARWSMGGRDTTPSALWSRLASKPSLVDLIVHVIPSWPGQYLVTFAAVDDPRAIADAIGNVFDALLTESHPSHSGMDEIEEESQRWRDQADQLPRKVQVDTPLALYDETHPFPIFSA
jgi:hypothetical protein